MKTLYLVRHAKSSWEFDVIDHERPLNDRGFNDAPVIAAHIAAKMRKPDLFLSSDALRAKTTALFFAKVYKVPEEEIKLDHKLYDFAGRDVVEVIKALDDQLDCVMIFGHNNAMTNFVNTYGDKLIDNVATASFTVIEFTIDKWSDLNMGKTSYTIAPKELNND